MVLERRRAPRARSGEPAVLHLAGRRVVCSTIDLSATGIALRAPPGVPWPTARVRLLFSIPGDLAWAELEGRVVREGRAADRGRIWGVRFENATPEIAERIGRFVQNRARQSTSATLGGGAGGANPRSVGRQTDPSIRELYREAVLQVEEEEQQLR